MRRFSLRKIAAALTLALATSATAQELPRLPSIDSTQISVSGLSSGAFMTVQLSVAYSDLFMGAAVVAGGPYYCAAGMISNAGICMGQIPFVPPNPYLMVQAAKTFAAQNLIPPLSNVAKERVYVFSGTSDSVVGQSAVDATNRFYQLVGVPDSALKYVNSLPAGHAFITADPSFNGAGACSVNAPPYINKCQTSAGTYDQAGELFKHIYSSTALKPPAATPTGTLAAFDQTPFDPNPLVSALGSTGHVYIPQACQNGAANTCRLHVSIHGCGQNEQSVGNKWYTDLYLNNWADTNNIVVIYPQVDPSLVNPQGCWDWFGYTGPNYAVKSGVQPTAIVNMVKKVAGMN